MMTRSKHTIMIPPSLFPGQANHTRGDHIMLTMGSDFNYEVGLYPWYMARALAQRVVTGRTPRCGTRTWIS